VSTPASRILAKIAEDEKRLVVAVVVTPRAGTNARSLKNSADSALNSLNRVESVDSGYDVQTGVSTFYLTPEPGATDLVKGYGHGALQKIKNDGEMALTWTGGTVSWKEAHAGGKT
jgi:hypothetical protein